jgi:hypothetical protein
MDTFYKDFKKIQAYSNIESVKTGLADNFQTNVSFSIQNKRAKISIHILSSVFSLHVFDAR